MKFTYEFIKENLRIYNEAKQKMPIISEFEKGDITLNAMRNIGLQPFADFFYFLLSIEKSGFLPIQAISLKDLKQILIDNTKTPRFKNWLKNRSLKSIKNLIEEDSQSFDRLLNGRWVTKPGYTNRGRKSWGRRSNEFVEGLDVAFIPLLNYIISNDIDVTESSSECFKKFSHQDKYFSRIKWYTGVCLNLEEVPQSEIDITHNMLNSVVSFVEGSNMDFRKLNSDFIIETLSAKIRSLMTIPKGSVIRCKTNLSSSYGTPRITIGKNYVVESSNISSGFLRVMVTDDHDIKNWYDYRNFEDKSVDRELLLAQLGII